jgi:hypothetical protein
MMVMVRDIVSPHRYDQQQQNESECNEFVWRWALNNSPCQGWWVVIFTVQSSDLSIFFLANKEGAMRRSGQCIS